jgi:hypothetical protein
MHEYSPASLAGPAVAAALLPEHLGGLNAEQQAQLLVMPPPPYLTVDCGGQSAPPPLGVCRFVSYLLLLRQRGTSIRLCNVHPVLYRCLLLLRLESVLHLNG